MTHFATHGLRTLDENTRLAFRELPLYEQGRRYVTRRAAAAAGDGLLVRTRTPLPAGTVLGVELRRESDEGETAVCRGLAVVRWRTLLPGLRAMTLDLVDVEGDAAFAEAVAAATCNLGEALLPGRPAIARWAAAALETAFLPTEAWCSGSNELALARAPRAA